MNARTMLTPLCAASAALAVSTAATAFDGACATELNALESSIQSASFIGPKASTDQSNLLAKLTAAEAKVTQRKFSDAIDKLTDITDTATALATAAKPKLVDATAINTSTAAAMACVGGLN